MIYIEWTNNYLDPKNPKTPIMILLDRGSGPVNIIKYTEDGAVATIENSIDLTPLSIWHVKEVNYNEV